MSKHLRKVVTLLTLTIFSSHLVQGQIVPAPALTYAGPQTYTAATPVTTLSPVNTGGAVPATAYAQTSTVGSGTNYIFGVVTDAAHNLYIADANANLIRKVTPAGVETRFAGNGTQGFVNGTGSAASFYRPQGLAIDASGNIYVADAGNNVIREIDPYGVVTTFAGNAAGGNTDGTGTAASFNNPVGIAIDGSGNAYVSDNGNELIRKITPAGVVTSLAGNEEDASIDGLNRNASFASPYGIAVDASGNIYVADYNGDVIRKVTQAGLVSTIAGNHTTGAVNGPGTAASFNNPQGLTIDLVGNLYVAEYGNQLIRKITPAYVVTTLAGGGVAGNGIGTAAGFYFPEGITFDSAGNLYVAEFNDVREISITGYSIAPALPAGLAFDSSTGNITGVPLLAATAATYSITAYNTGGSGTASVGITVNGTITPPVNPVSAPVIAYTSPQNYTTGTTITTLTPANTGGAVPAAAYGQTTTPASNLGNSNGVAVDAAGNIYYADISGTGDVIRKITPAGSVSIFVGSGVTGNTNGTGTAASFNSPQGIAFDVAGNLYVADKLNNLIRKVTATGVVTTFAGSGALGHSDGPAASASFDSPTGIAADAYGDVYVSDNADGLIRRISPSGIVTTIAGGGPGSYADGTGTAATFSDPSGIAIDGTGNIYVADQGNNVIRKITPAGVVTTVAGTAGMHGSANGTGGAASFYDPQDLILDALGNIYVTDNANNLVRKITPAGVVTTVAGNITGFNSADGIGTAAAFKSPQGITIDASGNLYISDVVGNVRKVSTLGYTIGSALPAGLVFDPTTGNISGTPLAASAATGYTISAFNTGGSSNTTLNVTVAGSLTAPANPVNAPVITYASPQTYPAGTTIATLTPANTGGAVPALAYGQTTTIAKNLGNAFGVATDASGNIYYADETSNVIRKITPAGVPSVFAGNNSAGYINGTGTSTSFSSPQQLAFDAAGNLYVADKGNNVIREITPAGVVTTFAGSGQNGRGDGPGTSASFSQPTGVTVDAYGNVYVADYGNDIIRRISQSGVVTTIAGSGAGGYADGTGAAAIFNDPFSVGVDGLCNVYVTDLGNNVIRKITPTGVVTTIAGTQNVRGAVNGTGAAASFNSPQTLVLDAVGNIYVADNSNYLIREIGPAGVVTTLAGNVSNSTSTNGIGTAAGFASPQGIAIDAAGNLYVSDPVGNLRKVSTTGFYTGTALPAGLTFDPTTGNITGIPLLATTATNYVVSAYNTGGNSNATVNIAVTGNLTAPAAISAPAISYTTPQSYPAGTAISPLNPANTGGAVPATIYGQTTTFAGAGTIGEVNGAEANATFNNPQSTAADLYGNVYIADFTNNLIRKISSDGVVSTLAGSGTGTYMDGTGTAASFNGPSGIAIDVSGNIYVADEYNQLIRKITPAGVVTTLAGTAGAYGAVNGTGTGASFYYPTGLAVDASGNVYVADGSNQLIRKITPAGVVTTLAGTAGTTGYVNGTGTAAKFNNPYSVAVDASGNVYVSDQNNAIIRKITSAGVVSALAGTPGITGFSDGAGTAASFSSPRGITVDRAGNVYVADMANNLVREISPAGLVTTLAGNPISGAINGIGNTATFSAPQGISIDYLGNLYIGDTGNDLIRKITATGYTTTQVLPAGLALNGATGVISGTPTTPLAAANYIITAINGGGSSSATLSIAVTGTAVAATTVAAPKISYATPQSYPAGIVITSLSPANTGGAVPAQAYAQSAAVSFSTSLTSNFGMAVDAAGDIYFSDANAAIKKVLPSGEVVDFAGSATSGAVNGQGTAASFYSPQGIAIDATGNLYVVDQSNYLIRKITPAGLVTTVAGSAGNNGSANGTSTAATFYNPFGVAVDNAGNLYITDAGNNLIRKITPAGVVTTLAGSGSAAFANGTGTAASFNNPQGIAIDASGNLYVTDANNQVIRKITAAGVVTTLAGTAGTTGFANGTGTSATFHSPQGITIDGLGNLYVADMGNHVIRTVTSAGVVTTLAGGNTTLGTDGTPGIGTNAGFTTVYGLAINNTNGNLLVSSEASFIYEVSLGGYSINNPLPTGLNFDATTGIVSGTPTVAATAANYVITAYNAGGNSSTTLNLAVTGSITAPVNPVQAPVISYASPQSYTAGTAITALPPANTGGAVPATIYGETSTTAAGFSASNGIVTDAAGNIYMADNRGDVIRKITPAGVSSVFAGYGSAGSANGTGTAASFNNPLGLAIDASGNLYVADAGNGLIRKITPAGVVTTFAGAGIGINTDINGPAASATFTTPSGIAVDNFGNVYVADQGDNLVRKISAAGDVSTLAGNGTAGFANGTGAAASFNQPSGLAVDGLGNVYVADYINQVIRKITSAGVVSTFAGTVGVSGSANGTGTAASFDNPIGLAVDAAGNIYVADNTSSLIRKITPAAVVTTLAGGASGDVNGIGSSAGFSNPGGICVDASGNLYVPDGPAVRKISSTGYVLTGTALPAGLVFDPSTGIITGTPLATTTAANYTVSACNTGGSSTTTVNIAVTGAITPPANPVTAPAITYTTPQSYAAGTAIAALKPSNSGGAVPAATYSEVTYFTGASLNGVATDAAGNLYYTNTSEIFKATPGGTSYVIAGSTSPGYVNGAGTAARFNSPTGLTVDASGNIYVADVNNNAIRKITPTGIVTTLAGGNGIGRDDGPGATASFNNPQNLVVDSYGNVYVIDVGNYLVRKISPTGEVNTLAGSGSSGFNNGTGTNATFNTLAGITIDGTENLYVTDQGNDAIRKITPAGVVSTFAGIAGTSGAANGTGTAASFNKPNGIAIDATGNLYVADGNNYLIRKISPAAVVTTLAGTGTIGTTNGVGISASFSIPLWVATDASGNLYEFDDAFRKISLVGYAITGNLPEGLSFDNSTGIFSGTPLAAATATNYTVNAYNTGGSSTATVNLAVTGTATVPAAPTTPVISYTTPHIYAIGFPITPLTPNSTGGAIPATVYGQVSTFAGSITSGFDNGTGTAASFNNILDMATDAYGNIYEADAGNNVIRRISSSGVVATFAGSGAVGYTNATGTAASFSNPHGAAVDAGNNVYVSDYGNQVIRKITPTGVVTTLAGSGTAGSANGTGTAASFNGPGGIAVDNSGNLYVVDENNYEIRKITAAGVVTTLAGNGSFGVVNGTGSAAGFGSISNLCIDGSGNIYVYDSNLVRKITSAGVVTTLAGSGSAGYADGAGTGASFSANIGELKTDAGGNIYLVDASNYLIRKITPAGMVTTIAGNGSQTFFNGVGTSAAFSNPVAIAPDNFGNLYISDGNIIRQMYIGGYTITVPFPLGLSFSNTTGIISGNPTAASPSTTYVVNGNNSAGTGTSSLNITVIYPPLVTTTTPVTAFTSMGDVTPVPVVIDGGATVTDPSQTTLASATISITGGFVAAEDVLGFTSNLNTTGNIGGAYNSTTGVLSLTSAGSTATLAQWTTALQSVTYNDINDAKPTTGNRIISFTASDGTFSCVTPATKTISVTYTPSHNANLSSLVPSSGTLSPVFAGATTTYTAAVSNSVTSITITPTTASVYATITVNGTPLASGTASASIPLSIGTNTITTVVTAEDLSTVLTYTTTVTRDASQVITFNPLNTMTYGAAAFAPGATSTSSAEAITYTSSNTSVATIVSGNITIVGAGSTTITASQAGSAGYDPATSVSQTLGVSQAMLTATATNKTKVYGTANPALTINYSGFVNGDTQSSLNPQPTVSTSATTNPGVGSYPITFGATFYSNYTVNYVSGTLTVTAAPLTITANNLTKGYEAALQTLTATYAGLVNGDTKSSLTTPPNITTTATASSAPGSYPISISGAADANYNISYVAGTLTVSTSMFAFGPILSQVYGAADFSAGASSTQSIAYASSNAAVATIVSGNIHIVGVGSSTITATSNGSNLTQTLTVTQAPLTITAVNQSKTYAAANPALTITYSGFVNSESQNALSSQPAIQTTAATLSAPGSYPITVSGATAANYSITYVQGTLTVSPAALTITTTEQNRVYGAANPTLTLTYSGFVNGDTQASLSTQPSISTNATTASPVGSYVIAASGAVDANYAITYVNNFLTISQAPLTITAASQAKVYGAANPVLTMNYTGFVNGDNQTSLSSQPTISTTASATSAAGSYPITVGGGFGANYSITYVAGSLTVDQAALTITATSESKAVGTANPTLTVTYTGFVNGDTQSSLTTQPTVTTTATTTSPAGTYPITPSSAADANYNISYVGGTLTVSASTFVFAAIPSQTYGTADFSPGASSTGTITYASSNSAVATIVAGNIHITGVGTSTITATSGGTNLTQTLTVTPAALTIMAADQAKTYGAANPALTITYIGFVYSDTQASLTTQPTIATTATASSAVGSYPVTASGAADANYTISYTSGNLTINTAALTITANNQSKAAGTANPTLTIGITGFVNGDTQASLSTQPTVTTTATTTSPVGTYPITASSAVDANYTISYVAGTLTVLVPASSPVINYAGPQSYPIGTAIASLSPANTGGAVPATIYDQVSTFAGSGTAGAVNGTGTAASFKLPYGVATDASGNIYVAEYGNNLIRKITTAGVVTTFAGSGTAGAANGTGTAASFKLPYGIAVDPSGNVYVADEGNNLIRKITPGGVVTTLAGIAGTAGSANGTGTAASFNQPYGVATDANGNVYVADAGNDLIREISPAGVVTTLAGTAGTTGSANGTGTAATFNKPTGVALDATGNVYVADETNNLIRKITAGGVVTTLAGSGTAGHVNGTGTAATFYFPIGVTTDASGDVYVADEGNKLIREISPAGVVTTLAGIAGTVGSANGIGTAASFNQPTGVATDGLGNVYVADYANDLIRKISVSGYTITPVLPAGLAFDGTTGIISGTPTAVSGATSYTVTAYNGGGTGNATVTISVYMPLSAPVINYAGPQSYPIGTAIASLSPANTGGAVPATIYDQVSTFAGSGTAGAVNGTGTAASFKLPYGVATDASGNIYVAEYGNNLIRKITTAGVVTTFAGSGTAGAANGTGTAASFKLPYGIAVDPSGNVYVADEGNNLIRKITPGGVVTTLAGIAGTAGSANGTGTAASFNQPYGVATDANGNVYVADAGNDLIREISPAGVVTTLAGTAGTTGSANGTGTAATFNKPTGVALDATGNVYVADETNNLIRKITAGGVVTTLAGSGTAGHVNGTGTAATFYFPIGVTTDASGDVYVADEGNKLIREISPAGVVTTLAGIAGTVGSANGIGTAASFNQPTGVATDGLGNVYVADYANDLIRKISVSGYTITPVLPAGLAFDGTTGIISGTPTAVSPPITYAITAYNTAGSGAASLNISTYSALAAPVISYAGPQTYTTGTAITSLTPTNTGGAVPATIYDQVVTFAGSGTAGSANGTGTAASFKLPYGVATDASGNVYVAEYGNNLVRKITPAGVVTTLAGSGSAGAVNGTGTAASFKLPYGIALDPSGNVYVADAGNNLIRKITAAGVVTTFAGSGSAGAVNGTGTDASFNQPYGIAADASGNIYVGDAGNDLVRKISPSGVVTTLAGTAGTAGAVNGTGTAASFSKPTGVAVDAMGNVYVADNSNNLIRKITQAGVVTTLAGSGAGGHVNGTGAAATFYSPLGVTTDAVGDVYVADEGNKLIREISPAGVVTTLAGIAGTAGAANGIGTAASFNQPTGVAIDGLGNLYVADYSNDLIRKINITGYTISPVLPAGLSFDGTTGIMSGTPTAAIGATTYTVIAYNTAGSSTTTVSITVNAAPGPKVYYMGPQRYTVNTIITPLIPTNTGGEIPEASFVQDTAVVATTDSAHRSTPGVQFSRFIVNGTNYEARKAMVTGYGISPALPAGLSLDNSTGTISGIPTADIPATDFTITAYNLQGNSIAHLTITVNSLDINGKITKTGIDPYQASLDTTALAPIVHQAVSPNGDGKDDFLLIENITSYPDNKITLVDRNGALVYRAEGYDNANKLFDGHSSLTGALQKPGTYFYLLDYVDNGVTKHQTGFFVIKY